MGSAMERMLGNPLPGILALVALVAGIAALALTPREEEPQIAVPIADVVIQAPGLGARQVERQVATPLEKLLHQIEGVEYVYSTSRPGRAVVTARFYVGEDREASVLKLRDKLQSNVDQVPDAVSSWVVKPVDVDDVPILLAVLWSEDRARIGDHELRRLAEEMEQRLQAVDNTNRVEVTGGRPRQLRVELDPDALAARDTAPLDVAVAIGLSNKSLEAGQLIELDRVVIAEAGAFLDDVDELRRLVVNVVDGVPVHLEDVARIIDGPAEPETYSWIGFGPASEHGAAGGVQPAVTLSVAKKQGTNAVWVSRDIEQRLEQFSRELFPDGVHYRVIRDYGETANQKVNDLVSSLGLAVLTVVIFLAVFVGWRAALVVGLAVPVCYGITLFLDYLTGYTINRVTLFALILALGLLVDDPITGVDNIDRYFRMGLHEARRSVAAAMMEIRSALVMSTVAIVVAFLPMLFITGMMGPYMAPMAFNVPVTVIVSTLVAFIVTPWLAYRVLRHDAEPGGYDVRRTLTYRLYAPVVRALTASRRRAWIFMAAVGLVFVVSVSLPAFRLVPLKLLPYDNKNEFQIVIDMPEGTTLERTQVVTRALAEHLRTVPEVRDFTAYVGAASPMDFNGMVRRYYLRDAPHQADIRVTLAPRARRAHQSHQLLLRIRRDLEAVAARHDAPIKLVEVPPGPPVVATVTAEIRGTPATPYARLREGAQRLAERMRVEPGLVDVDTSVEAEQRKLRFVTDKEKAALSGVATEDITRTMRLAVGGMTAGHLQVPSEVNPLPIRLRLPQADRNDAADLAALYVKGRAGVAQVEERGGLREAPRPLIQLGELGRFEQTTRDRAIHHKNLDRVAYVYAEVAGRTPAEVIQDLVADQGRAGDGRQPVSARTFLDPGGGPGWDLPEGVEASWVGEGEWFITLRVFRDLGIAFGVAVVGIFAVLYIQTGLASLAGIILLAIPLSMIGIMPGFWLLNASVGGSIDGFADPVFFTATAMIGMIALAGIVVRNSLVLVEFIRLSLREGMELREALARSGAVRMRPVLLTAATTLLGNMVITLDPIFSGLAWAIIFGIVASTVFTLAVVPAVYFLVYGGRDDGAEANGAAQ